ncbi:hypothetical protein CHARACLAT_020540 [Characodon lateralis]|uniref:DUF4764 domain-containing protein n=1 Tax=Characodon lateralis TaxID=208331 RepID=A0ABU7DC97_9TELE|nr:hypothetical protein [Characodon lateralis]
MPSGERFYDEKRPYLLVTLGLVGRPGRRGRPPKLGVIPVTAKQQAERRQHRLEELVEQCEDEELMDVVLPRLTSMLSLWELLLAKLECKGSACSCFPDIYHEFESLHAQVRQTAQDYIISPQGGAMPVEVRNIEVARSLGILDEVNKMKVVPGASPASSVNNKNVRYMGNSKMLPPSKRFKMENSIADHQNGTEAPRTGAVPVTSGTPTVSLLKSCSVSVSPLEISGGSKVLTTSAEPTSSSSTTASGKPTLNLVPPSASLTEEQEALVHPEKHVNIADTTVQMTQPDSSLSSSPKSTTDTKTLESSSTQAAASVELQQCDSSKPDPGTKEPKELQAGQEIYIQTEGLTVQLAEAGSDGIVIVNGPDGTTMHIQTPEGVPLEAVQALLGIEASDGDRPSQQIQD